MRLSETQASDLIAVLKTLTDPRCKRGVRHRNLSIIAISICAVICGCRGYTAIAQWAQQCSQKMLERLWCRKKGDRYIPPSEPTIRRQLQRIDAEEVDRAISDWPVICPPEAPSVSTEKRSEARGGMMARKCISCLPSSTSRVSPSPKKKCPPPATKSPQPSLC